MSGKVSIVHRVIAVHTGAAVSFPLEVRDSEKDAKRRAEQLGKKLAATVHGTVLCVQKKRVTGELYYEPVMPTMGFLETLGVVNIGHPVVTTKVLSDSDIVVPEKKIILPD